MNGLGGYSCFKMDGKSFVKEFTRILEKVCKITGISYNDRIIISDDPECDADYGVDKNGNLVIDCECTNLKLSELREIRYRAKSGMIEDCNGHISFVFNNGMEFYIHFDSMIGLGNQIYSVNFHNGACDCSNYVKELIHIKNLDWNSQFIVSDNKLLLYIGIQKDVVIPKGITEIRESAFARTHITSVVLPETLTYIGNMAFSETNIDSICLPKSITYIGNGAFRLTPLESTKNIKNYSDIIIDDRVW